MELSGWRIAGIVLVALILVGVGIWLLRRRYQSSSSTGNEDTGEQRQQAYREQRDRSIPLRTRAMRTPLEGKVIGFLALAIFVIVMYEVYSFMKTGSPSQVAAAWETKFLTGSMVAFGVGIWYDRRRKANTEGRVDVTYEAAPEIGEEERVVTYYFDPRDTIWTDKGPVVFERKENRRFGLFRMPKLHGDDRRFRDVEDPRPPGDKIGLELPSHARKVGPNHWSFRTKGHIILDSADSQGDIQFLPAYNKSREQEMQRATDIDNLQTQVKELKARNAQLEQSQRHRQEGQKNEIDELLDQIERVTERMQGMFQGKMNQVRITEENRVPSHSERGQNGHADADAPAPVGQQQNGRQRGEN